MHFTNLLTLLLTTSSLATASTWFTSDSQSVLDEPHPVPGDNPLIYCEDPKDYLLTIDKADLSPNPPKAGAKLSVTGTGTLKEDIEKGAKLHLKVKYGLLQILNLESDLCDYASQVDLSCPLKKGDLKIKKDVDLPKEIPPGKYTVLAEVYTKDNEKVTCMTATVSFNFGGVGKAEEL